MGLWDTMFSFLKSGFVFPGLSWYLMLAGIGLGLVFGAFWLLWYRPPLLRERQLWLIGIVSAFLTWIAIAFVQIPLQSWTSDLLQVFWPPLVINHWLLYASIPSILLSGIVQEASKIAPVLLWKWRRGEVPVQTIVLAGAVAGVGFGIFEAVWIHNSVLASGWTWSLVSSHGYTALIPFWERFFTVGFHIAASTVAAWGVAKGMGWRFYLLAALLHGILNYGSVLLQRRLLSGNSVEVYVAVIAVMVTGLALWLRSRAAADAD
jgi:hypothetical protein